MGSIKWKQICFSGVVFLLALLSSPLRVEADAFKPSGDSFVVEKLPRSLICFQKLRIPAAHSRDLTGSLLLAREYLQIGQRTSDLAFVRYAEELLRPWQTNESAEVLFLGAVISQHRHDFATALSKLEPAFRLAPQNSEIPLLRSSILTTLGRYNEVKGIFAANLRLTSTLRGLTIFLTATSLNGGLAKSRQALERAIAPRADQSEQAFAWCALAEMAVRQGDLASAEISFRKALAIEPANSYTLSAYVDLLMATGRQREVLPLIDPAASSEALITRRLLAMNASRDQAASFAAQLVASGHLRELAMIQLDLLNDPQSALESALTNWQNQRESIDAILVLRSALMGASPGSARPVVNWLRQASLEDERIQQLVGRLQFTVTQQ